MKQDTPSGNDEAAVVVKRYRSSSHKLQQFKYGILRCLAFPVPARYRSPGERCRYEEACLRQWARFGFSVPKLLEPREKESLCMEQVPGETLHNFLLSSKEEGEKLAVLSTVFGEMRVRHQVAFAKRERRLIHFEVEANHLIVGPKGVVHTNFVMANDALPLNSAVYQEILDLTKDCAELLGSTKLPELTQLLIHAYRGTGILRDLVKEVLGNPLLPLVELKERRRKVRSPSFVSKGDIARELSRSLGRSAASKPSLLHG